MTDKPLLLDTHALFSWVTGEAASGSFVDFLDEQNREGNVYISPISFWEIALLCKVGKMALQNVETWAEEVLRYSQAKLLEPGVADMIRSTLLPNHHRDPFDRLLIAQSKSLKGSLVTKDKLIRKYPVEIFWP